MKTLQAIRKATDALVVKHAAALQHADAETVGVATAQTEYRDALEARRIAQEIARKTQTEASRPITDIVNRCLAAVFDDPYTMRVDFELRRGKTEVDLRFARGGNTVDPIGASGGGVVDIASFALRLAVLLLSVPKAQRVLILDESFRFVSAAFRPRLKALLQQLTTELQVQVIQVTHIADLAIGNVILIGDD